MLGWKVRRCVGVEGETMRFVFYIKTVLQFRYRKKYENK